MNLRWSRGLLGLGALTLCASARVVYGELGDAPGGISADLAHGQLLAEVETNAARQSQLEQEQTQLTQQQHELRGELERHVRALYRVTRSGTAPITGGFDAVRVHVARIRRLRSLVERDAAEWSQLEARSRATASEAVLTRAALEQAREKLKAREAEANLGIENVPALPVAAATPPPAATDHGFYGLRLSGAEPESGAPRTKFSAQRGKLALPVSGEARIMEVKRGPAQSPALWIEAPAGTTVRAVASGRVAFCESVGSYGRMVIIDHGGGYASKYGRLGDVDVRVGDEVSSQARIGNIGDKATTPGIIFELKHNSRSIPPKIWFGL